MSDPEKSKRPPVKKAVSAPADFNIINLGDYYAMIRERWFLGLACAILVSAVVGYLLMSRPPTYQAQSSLLWEQSERILDIPDVLDTGLDSAGGMWQVRLSNHINQITSWSFRQEVADSFTEEEGRKIVAPYLPEDESEPAPSVVGAMGEIAVASVPNSFMARIQVRHRDPEAAALVANRYAERYIEFANERRAGGNEDAVTFLTERAEEFRQRVREAEEALQEYRRENNLVSVEENQNLVAQRLNGIHQSLMNARLARLELERELRQVERLLANDGNLLELGRLVAEGATGGLIGQLEQLRREREVMSVRYLERHPEMIANQREMESVESLIRDNIERSVADLRNRLDGAREREETLQAELDVAEQESLSLDRMRIEYTSLQNRVEGARQSYAQILERLNETAITSSMENARIRVSDRAYVPGAPVEPDLARVAIITVFLGGLFFVGTPIGLGVLDQRLKASMDVEKFLGGTLLAEMPIIRGVKEKDRNRIVEKGLDDRTMEAFRGLCSRLSLNWENEFPQALITASTIPGEGKSFLVSNLGYCFAAHGRRTVLVDFDFRRPSLHRTYGLSNDAGILRWLREGGVIRDDLLEEEALGITEVAPKLFVLRAGGATKKATEAISNAAVPKLIHALKRQFDFIVMDTPPLGIFPEALTLSQLADHSVYVTRFGRVDRRQVKSVVGRLQETDAGFMGVVMNGMPRGRRFSHYYSDYGIGNYKYERYYAGKD